MCLYWRPANEAHCSTSCFLFLVLIHKYLGINSKQNYFKSVQCCIIVMHLMNGIIQNDQLNFILCFYCKSKQRRINLIKMSLLKLHHHHLLFQFHLFKVLPLLAGCSNAVKYSADSFSLLKVASGFRSNNPPRPSVPGQLHKCDTLCRISLKIYYGWQENCPYLYNEGS